MQWFSVLSQFHNLYRPAVFTSWKHRINCKPILSVSSSGMSHKCVHGLLTLKAVRMELSARPLFDTGSIFFHMSTICVHHWVSPTVSSHSSLKTYCIGRQQYNSSSPPPAHSPLCCHTNTSQNNQTSVDGAYTALHCMWLAVGKGTGLKGQCLWHMF